MEEMATDEDPAKRRKGSERSGTKTRSTVANWSIVKGQGNCVGQREGTSH